MRDGETRRGSSCAPPIREAERHRGRLDLGALVLDEMTTLMVFCRPKRLKAATRDRTWSDAVFIALVVRLLFGLQPDGGRTGIIPDAGVDLPSRPRR